MSPKFKVTGPKGGLIIRAATPARIKASVAGLVKRFGRINVQAAPAPPPPKPDPRATAVKAMRFLIANEPKVHYAQARPMRTRQIHTMLQLEAAVNTNAGISIDCSEAATLVCRVAGLPDPNGNGYNGAGYTGTLLAHLKLTTKERAAAGDMVVFGPGAGHHVCTILQPGADPLLFSHGQERGPLAIRFSEEARFQPGPARWLKVDESGTL